MISRYYFKNVGCVKLDTDVNSNFGCKYYVQTYTCADRRVCETDFDDYKQAEIAFHLEVVKLINSIDKEVNV